MYCYSLDCFDFMEFISDFLKVCCFLLSFVVLLGFFLAHPLEHEGSTLNVFEASVVVPSEFFGVAVV